MTILELLTSLQGEGIDISVDQQTVAHAIARLGIDPNSDLPMPTTDSYGFAA